MSARLALILFLAFIVYFIPYHLYANEYLSYAPAEFYVYTNVPETEAEIAEAYPELRHSYQAIGELGHSQLFSEFKIVSAATPHIPWAKPWAGGKLRILYIKQSGVEGCDLREITQRLDCDAELMILPQTWCPHPGLDRMIEFGNKRALQILDQPFDVAFISATAAGFWPAVQDKLLAKIKNGMGVVFVTDGTYQKCALYDEVCGLKPPEKKHFREHGVTPLASGKRPTVTSHFVVNGIPWEMFPSISVFNCYQKQDSEVVALVKNGSYKFPLVIASQCGKGRVVTLCYNSGYIGNTYTPGMKMWEKPGRYWEFPVTLLVRAALWASGKESNVQISMNAPPEIKWGEVLPARLGVSGLANQKVFIEILLHDEACNNLLTFSKEMTAHKDILYVDLAGKTLGDKQVEQPYVLPAGSYVLSAIIRDQNGKSMGFASTAFQVAPMASLKIEARPQYLEAGQKFKLGIRVDQMTNLPPLSSLVASITIKDTWGRQIERQSLNVKTGTEVEAGPFNSSRNRGGMLFASVALEAQGKPIANAQTDIYTPQFGWDDFQLIFWPLSLIGYNAAIDMDAYRAIGATALYLGGWPYALDTYRQTVFSNLRFVNAAMGAFARNDNAMGAKHMHQYLSDPKAEERQREYIEPATREVRKYGTIWANLCDEPHLCAYAHEVDYSDYVIGKLRERLKKTYGEDIAKLNAAWGTQFSGWNEVKPDFIADAKKRETNFAPWLDHKVFVDELFADAYAGFDPIYTEMAGRHVDYGPDGLFGFQPHYVPAGGMDYARICRPGRRFSTYGCEWGDNHHYGHVKCWQVVRSFLEPWKMLTLTSGSVYTPYYMLWNDPWYCAFNGGSGYLIYNGITYVSDLGALWHRAAVLRDSTRELREGIGKLLMQSRLEPAQVGILYVHPSYYLRCLLNAKGVQGGHINYQNSRYAFERLCLDSQAPFRYVRWTEPTLQALAGLKVLCLTGCDALPDEWIPVIRQFVDEGGAVVADLLPGWYTIHGSPRGKGALDDLFGVERKANLVMETAPAFTAGIMKPSKELDGYAGWPSVAVFEAGVKVIDGEKLGDNFARSLPPEIKYVSGKEPELKYVAETQPAFVFKKTNKGFALLFNFLLDQYAFYPDKQFRDFFQVILRKQRVTLSSHLAMSEFPADPLPFLNVNRYWSDGGKIEHMAALRDNELGGGNPNDLKLRFLASGHLYDVRAGKYLGEGKETMIRMEPGAGLGAKLITRLPYKVEKLTIQGTATAKPGEDAVFDLCIIPSSGDAVEHVIRIDVFDPEGKVASPYCGNFVAPKGKLGYILPFALNDRPGKWVIKAKDIISSATVEHAVKLK